MIYEAIPITPEMSNEEKLATAIKFVLEHGTCFMSAIEGDMDCDFEQWGKEVKMLLQECGYPFIEE